MPIESIIEIKINCGEKTCASSPGLFCRFCNLREISCQLFGKLFEEDNWIMRHPNCKSVKKNDLKTCPFCGTLPKIIDIYNDDEGALFGICCSYVNCPADAACVYADTKIDVTRLWNTRAS